MKWVMFGDSGEKDYEIYHAMKKRYPQKVLQYYIHDIQSGEIKAY